MNNPSLYAFVWLYGANEHIAVSCICKSVSNIIAVSAHKLMICTHLQCRQLRAIALSFIYTSRILGRNHYMKKQIKSLIIILSVLLIAIIGMTAWYMVNQAIPNQKYQEAVALRESGQYEDAIAAFADLGDYSDAETQITKTKYQQATALRESGQYEAAIAAFSKLGDYSDVRVQINKTKYQQATALRESGQYEAAIAVFTKLGNYSDAATQITETKYQQATNLNAVSKYNEAYTIYTTIIGYKDVDKLLTTDGNLMAAARDIKFAVGNYVVLGTYPQTNVGNDATPIEWLVLDREGSNALLISHYGLDVQPYNTELTNVTWETCTLRKWLNGTFYTKAFSSTEQTAVLTASVDNSKNQGEFSVSAGNNTQDKVFLLSYKEANKYLGADFFDTFNKKSAVAPTAYALAQGAYTSPYHETTDGLSAGKWYLRRPAATSVAS